MIDYSKIYPLLLNSQLDGQKILDHIFINIDQVPSAQSLASEFAIKYRLSNEAQSRITRMIQSQLSPQQMQAFVMPNKMQQIVVNITIDNLVLNVPIQVNPSLTDFHELAKQLILDFGLSSEPIQFIKWQKAIVWVILYQLRQGGPIGTRDDIWLGYL